MEQALAKIRPHTSSSLAHQKAPAVLLAAIETTLAEQKQDPSPTAYTAALLTTLEGTLHKKNLGLEEGEVLPAELYLLALVAPFVPTPVLRTNLTTILTLTTPLFPLLTTHAPPLKSQLTLYQYVFQSLDRSQLDVQGVRQSFATILQLNIDPRPKVRKKATEVITAVLETPPAPLLCHPYAERVADWVQAVLSSVNEGPLVRTKNTKASESSGPETAIHLLAFLRMVLPNLHPSVLPSIIALLLPLPRLGNPYLSQSSYNVMSDLFKIMGEDTLVDAGERISSVLQVFLGSPPSQADTTLSPAWVEVLGTAMQAYKAVDTEGSAKQFNKVWKAVWPFLESSDASTRTAASESLEKLCTCITRPLVSPAIADNQGQTPLRKIITQISKALESLAFARSIPELLSVISALINGLGRRTEESGPTAAELLLLPLVQRIGELRTQASFECKEAADATLTVAMQVLGPEVLLRVLPLNLEEAERKAGLEPRAFLLPLLPYPHPSPLSHFTSYFVPLSERMFDAQQKAEVEGRPSEVKVWNVLVAQVWAGFVGYCHGTPDLKESLTPAFSQLLSQLLYGQPELRPAIFRGLKLMVDSNIAIAACEEPMEDVSITQQRAAENVAFLRTQVESWLAVFFNVFGTVGRDSRMVVGNVISVWLTIAGEQEISRAYTKVLGLLKNNLQGLHTNPTRQGDDSGNVTATTQDILILLLPYLSLTDATNLFDLCLSSEILSSKDNAIQKRGYKILSKLLETSKVTVDPLVVLRRLDELTDGLVAAAKKDRFSLLGCLVASIPSSSLYVIPSLIPEAVLGTKEPAEKSRTAAFELILSMGRKMSQGGVIKKALVDGMDQDGDDTAIANIEEFMTMVAGGLAGATPHMISATITAISRLVFEFKDAISSKMHTEIFTTILVFLSSANREIVKSALGFVKLAIHTLPVELIQPHLPELVKTLLKWSNDHKNHFKDKVRHIFERMIRRFGWENVYACAEAEEGSKLLLNIKKRKEHAKRKKANAKNEETTSGKAATGDAFEDILYGSESEQDEESDTEGVPVPSKQNQAARRVKFDQARLRADDNDPVDLLQGATSRITGGNIRRRKPGQDATHFKTDEETGKMVIDDDSEDGNDVPAADDVAGNAYRETITSVDGFSRGVNGRVKWNKDTKKRRRDNDNKDAEMVDAETVVNKTPPKQRRTQKRFGQEFKAKKAGGDVKKGGVDPYAYMPLSQAAKKGGGRQRVRIAGKV